MQETSVCSNVLNATPTDTTAQAEPRRNKMVEMSATYVGDKHCELKHGPSESKLETDAPRDNQGRGEKFSPTDLMGASLISCILTTMGIAAENDGINIKGATGRVTKEMTPPPRRISSLAVEITMPVGIPVNYRAKLEERANNCPVKLSLHPSIASPIQLIYLD
jgi:uncharacterized OsmC-like protein